MSGSDNCQARRSFQTARFANPQLHLPQLICYLGDRLRALIFWLHTGDVSFSPLRSEGIVAPDQPAIAYEPHACSPKSIYRLACEVCSPGLGCSPIPTVYTLQVDLEPLKKMAKDNIQSKLTPRNVLPELFSEFSSV